MKACCSGWYNDQPERSFFEGATGMDRIPVFVGLDYHMDSVQVCVLDRQGLVVMNRKGPNDGALIQGLVEAQGVVQGAAIEACTGAADLAEELVSRAHWPVDLAHPGFVARMKQNPDKTDYTDARMLADLERVGYLPRVWLAPREVKELRYLVRYRQQLVNQRRDIKLRITALLRDQRALFKGRRWTRAWHHWLEGVEALSPQARWIVDRHLASIADLSRRIEEAEARLAEVTAEDLVVAQLSGLRGIGPVTAWTLRAEIGRFDRFRTGKQLARFCGLSPRNASSGMRQADAGLIKAGNAQLRAVLIEAAHRLMRYDARWKALACQLGRRGKPRSVMAAAVANRWVRWLFHQMQPTSRVA
jgi:transposase